MQNRSSGSSYTRADRQDQAIGRLIRLLPLLTEKELDSLADRLGRKVHERCDAASWPPNADAAPDVSHQRLTGQVAAGTELQVDMVGH